MPHRELNQTGMNRVLWYMLKALGGKFEITNRELETLNRDLGIRITHHAIEDKFTLELHKILQPVPKKSKIIRLPQLSPSDLGAN